MNIFNDFSEAYDVMFPWSSRGSGEERFYSAIFSEFKVKSVLDCACGTGMHAVMSAKAGLRVSASDLAPAMIEQARRNARDSSVELDLRISSFTELSGVFDADEIFDAVFCLGNSLTLAASDHDVKKGIEEMALRLTDGGICVITIFNWPKIQREGLRILPASRGFFRGSEITFLRVFHDEGEFITLNIVAVTSGTTALSTQVLQARQRPIDFETLSGYVSDAGMEIVHAWGDQNRTVFDVEKSDNLILISRRSS